MNKIIGLDSIRLICALWVVFGHLGLPPILQGIDTSNKIGWVINAAYNATVSGPAAVIVFFVISGLCIHYPYKNGQELKLFGYYARRYIRIGIPLFVAILLSILLGINYSAFEQSILWSLAAELIYYTLYPGFRFIKNYMGWNLFILISFFLSFAVIFLINPRAGNYPAYGVTFNWLLGLPCWLLGCKLAETSEQLVKFPFNRIWLWRLGVWVASCLCLVLRFHSPLGYPYTLNIFAILIYFWLQKEIVYFRYNQPVNILEWAGKWSYSIYLMHVVAKQILISFNLPDLGYILNWIVLIAWAMVISYIFYALVEKPSHNLAKKIRNINFSPKLEKS